MILPIIGNYNFTTTNSIPTKTKRGLSRKAHPSQIFMYVYSDYCFSHIGIIVYILVAHQSGRKGNTFRGKM